MKQTASWNCNVCQNERRVSPEVMGAYQLNGWQGVHDMLGKKPLVMPP
jgi:hypothetical protein